MALDRPDTDRRIPLVDGVHEARFAWIGCMTKSSQELGTTSNFMTEPFADVYHLDQVTGKFVVECTIEEKQPGACFGQAKIFICSVFTSSSSTLDDMPSLVGHLWH